MRNLVLFLLLMLSFFSSAQEVGKDKRSITVKGHLIDNLSDDLSYIGLGLLNPDSTILKGTLTDSTGQFVFTNLHRGYYHLDLRNYSQGLYPIIINGEDSIIDVGSIQVDDFMRSEIQEITIKAKRPLIERKIDRTVVNIDGSILAIGNNMMDILKRLPGLSVRRDGELSLLGSPGVAVYIDGRGRALSPIELTVLLQSLQGINIDKIEIFSNPPARYASNQNAVINIITKKNKMKSQIGTSLGQALFPLDNNFGSDYWWLNLNFNLHYQLGKANLSYLFSLNDRKSLSVLNEDSFLSEITRSSTRTSTLRNQSFLNSFKIDIPFNEKNDLFIQAKVLSLPKSDIDAENLNFSRVLSDGSLSSYITDFSSDKRFTKPELYVSFQHLFDKAKEQSLSFDFVAGEFDFRSDLLQSDSRMIEPLTQSNSSVLGYKSIRTDYATKFLKNYEFSTGLKYTDLAYESDIVLASSTTMFQFDESIFASYFSLSGSLFKLQTKVGLRVESTDATGTSLSFPPINNNFVHYSPSIFLLKKLSQEVSLSLSYSRRLRRPSFEHYNSNIRTSVVDQFITQTGDPLLSPQTTDKFEFRTSLGSWRFVIQYLNEDKVRALFPAENDGDNLFLTTTTLDVDTYHLNINLPIQISSKWSSFNNLRLSNYRNSSANELISESFSYNFSSSQTLTLSNKIKFDLFLRYKSRFNYNYWELGDQLVVDASINFRILEGNADVKCSISNLFGSKSPFWNEIYNKIKIEENYLSNDREVKVAFSYRFDFGNKFRVKSKFTSDGHIR